MKYQGELSIVGACGGYSKTPAKHAPAVGNSVLNSPINILGSGSLRAQQRQVVSSLPLAGGSGGPSTIVVRASWHNLCPLCSMSCSS
jgi:hypothetical protein